MFQTNSKHTVYAKELELSDESFHQLAVRLSGFLTKVLKARNITYVDVKAIKDGAFVIADVMKKDKEQKIQSLIALGHHNVIRRYSQEIVELYQNGKGYQSISKILKDEHKAEVSSSTIRRFLDANKIEKGRK